MALTYKDFSELAEALKHCLEQMKLYSEVVLEVCDDDDIPNAAKFYWYEAIRDAEEAIAKAEGVQ